MSSKKSFLEEQKRQDVRRAVERALNKMPLRSTDERPPNLAEFSDSDDEAMKNRIGDVPLEWYADEDHIGYDVYGNKIARKEQGDSIDAFLARTDDPNAFRTVYDALNDEKIVLTDEELSIINRIRKGKFPHRDFDPNEDYSGPIESRVEMIGNAFEPKSRFIPSRWEAKKVVKYVHSIRNGWLKDPRKAPEAKKEDETEDLWGDEDAESLRSKHRLLLAPHKPLPPGHAESFNPPVEFLWTKKEREQQLALDPENRMYNFEPAKYDNLRNVPAYQNFVRERYERCLDLFLSARVRRKEKLNIDPNSLLPQLPKPKDLKPFPTTFSLEYIGHTGPVRSIDVDPTGQWLVSGAEDGSVRVWEITTARCVRLWNMKEQIVSVSWNPNAALPLVAVGLSTGVAILHTGTGTPEEAINAEHLLRSAPVIYKKGINIEKAAENASEKTAGKAVSKAEFMAKLAQWVSWWKREIPTDSLFAPVNDGVDAQGVSLEQKAKEKEQSKKRFRELAGVEETEEDGYEVDAENYEDDEEYDTTAGLARLLIRIDAGVSHVTWHGKGDYLATVSPVSTSRAVMVHRLSSAASQLPFSKNKGLVQKVQFHPSKPLFIVTTQRHVKLYNLSAGKLVRTLQSTSKWISSVAIHPQGEHILVGGYDRRVNWFDLDLSSTPYKTLKYHRRAVREVTFHRRFPLFATCSDDGQIHIMHNTIYDDLITNPLIVPVKIINAHIPVEDIGATQIVFHPKQPWIFSCAADKTIRLFS